MKLVDQGKLELIYRPEPEGPAVLVLKLDQWSVTVDLPVAELVQLLDKLPIADLLAKVLASTPGRPPAA